MIVSVRGRSEKGLLVSGGDADGPGILFWGGEAWCGVPPFFGNGHSEIGEALHDGVKLFGYPIWGCIDNILQKSVKNKDLLDRRFHNSGNIDGQLQGRIVLRLF